MPRGQSGRWIGYRVAEDGRGVHVWTRGRDDQHVEVAAVIAELLARSGQRIAAYWGRDATPLVDSLNGIGRRLRLTLPAIITALAQH